MKDIMSTEGAVTIYRIEQIQDLSINPPEKNPGFQDWQTIQVFQRDDRCLVKRVNYYFAQRIPGQASAGKE